MCNEEHVAEACQVLFATARGSSLWLLIHETFSADDKQGLWCLVCGFSTVGQQRSGCHNLKIDPKNTGRQKVSRGDTAGNLFRTLIFLNPSELTR